MATDRQGGLAAPAGPPPGRTDARKQMRLEIQRMREQGDEDDFYIDPRNIPDGMSYEWKRYYEAFQKPDQKYIATLKRMGWSPVPARRHPEIFGPSKSEDEIILFRDMCLMERPIEITLDAQRFELRRARKDIRDQGEKLRISSHELMPRKVQVAKSHHEATEIPGDDA